MTTPDPLPWHALADAAQARDDARRALELARDDFERELARIRLEKAGIEYTAACDRMALVAAVIFRAAAGQFGDGALSDPNPAMGYVLASTWKRISEFTGFALAFDMAKRAQRTAKAATSNMEHVLAELDALRDRVRELEKRIDDLTPGVGASGALRVVG